jgi:tripartite motif-containing protein 71
MFRVSVRAACLTLALAALASPSLATTVPVYLAHWGSQGKGPGQFDNLAGIAAPADGFVYVADSDQSRVLKFTNAGEFVDQFYVGAPLPSTPIEGVLGIGVDAMGRLYLSQHHIHRILRYFPDGTIDFIFGGSGEEPGFFRYPVDVKVDRDGYVWVVDQHNHRIQKLTQDGEFVLQLGQTDSIGTAPGLFYAPFGIALDSQGYVYVTDQNNSRVQKFDLQGNYVTHWGAPGKGPGQFTGATGIAVDPLDNVYVVDTFNNRVQMFSSTGAYLGEFGGLGSEPGQFTFPVNIACDAGGFLYVADENNYRVQKFGTKATPVARMSMGQLKARFK